MKLSSHCEDIRTDGRGFKAKAPPINGGECFMFIVEHSTEFVVLVIVFTSLS